MAKIPQTGYSRRVLGPLTTTFTPPAPCLVPVGLCTTCTEAWHGQECAPRSGTDAQDVETCWPATTNGAFKRAPPFLGWGFYSPGVVCPAGYTSACTATAGGQSDWIVQFLMTADETFVGCCPTGYTCDNVAGQTCLTRVSSTVLSTAMCTNGLSSQAPPLRLPNTALSISTVDVYAPMFQLAFRPSDLSRNGLLDSSSSPTFSSSTGAATGSSLPNAKSASPGGANSGSDPTSATSTGLTTGAAVGIGIGSAVLALAIAAAAFFIWRKKRRSSAPPATQTRCDIGAGQGYELPVQPVAYGQQYGTPKYGAEAGYPAISPVHELASETRVYEKET